MKTYELLFLNQRGRAIFGEITMGVKCYKHLHGADEPCAFCTNEIPLRRPEHCHTWVRQHPAIGMMLLHDNLIEYAGRLCRMEKAIDIGSPDRNNLRHGYGNKPILSVCESIHCNLPDENIEKYPDKRLQAHQKNKWIAYLQPLYDVSKNKIYGAEVLARKLDHEGKIHSPIEFIHIMEREGSISLLDYEMLRQSCELLVKWQEEWSNLILNVNFSRVTIHEADCVARVDEILRETGADPKQIIIEITESSQDMQFERMEECLSELKSRGFSIALDDMGTEAACLEMLYLPQLDIIKIDRSLICRSVNSEREKIVIEGLIDLCHRLGMTCVAEGIETEEQVELLKQLNCDRLQGYHIGKPMPAEEFFERFRPHETTTCLN